MEIMNQQLIDFYRGTAPDAEGRMLHEILAFDAEKMESVHTFIQWLFPLKEESAFNKKAPLLDDETIDIFKHDLQLKIKVAQALGRYLAFLQLSADKQTQKITMNEMHWLTYKNHNMRRLTRVMASLRYLGLEYFTEALYSCLCSIMNQTNIIDDETKEFWFQAAEGDLP